MSTQSQYQDAQQQDTEYQEAVVEDDELDDEPAPRSSMMPVVVSMVAGLLVVALLGVLMLTPKIAKPLPVNTDIPIGVQVGNRAPDFTLDRLDGKGQIMLSSYRGVKPVWVNIWATWCPPCRGEMPEMQQVWQQHKDKIEILGVDFKEDSSTVKNYVNQGGYSWNFVIDHDAAMSLQYDASAIPTHVFVDRNGIVQYVAKGGLSRASMDEAVAKVTAP
ncbi:MAG: TlpA family protein disulfide reductase [Chloroflexota bacterium]|nr:TlpA family protein disulfide reductase [Chloroflexota bacterium]